jgi:hypothetical protein
MITKEEQAENILCQFAPTLDGYKWLRLRIEMLIAEKEAYREVAARQGHVCHTGACQPVCQMLAYIDEEAQKILSGKSNG